MIEDDISIIEPCIKDLRRSLALGRTQKISFRKNQLKQLIKGLVDLKPKFDVALAEDLSLNSFNADYFSHKITIHEVQNTLENFEEWVKPINVDTPLVIGPAKSYIVKESLGLVLVMPAWNYPVYTGIPFLASAIAAGNCVILKPSEMAPNASKIIVELFEKYLDKNCFRCLEGKVEVAINLTSQPFDLIFFTGSTQKGKLVAQAAAKNLTPVILELGGKSPTIIDKNANLENASLRIAQGKLSNSGQSCVGCDYILIHESIKEKFIKKLIDVYQKFYGNNAKDSADYPRIINEMHTKRLARCINEDHGGVIRYGGKFDVEERYIEPCIIENPNQNSLLMKDEIFGPILPIITFTHFTEVINFINSKPKPLALYYFGCNFSKNIDRLISDTSSGSLVVNEALFQLANLNLPFGGVQESGSGSYHGKFGFDACIHLKPVFNKATINFWPFSSRFPPHTPRKVKMMNFLWKICMIDQKVLLKNFSMLIFVIMLIKLQKKGKLLPILKPIFNFIHDFLSRLEKKLK